MSLRQVELLVKKVRLSRFTQLREFTGLSRQRGILVGFDCKGSKYDRNGM